ncbi:MAG TPA: GNAT family N-acetyltransferase [Clostridiales bacterium]|jgi:N-acetylglutamate synthase-like GNAT family acetyltransferase|nr:GNAT family N-acetyltransferase [Clostridiales bacterium]
MRIRRFQEEDAALVSELIATTLRKTNAENYSVEYIENLIQHLNPKEILRRAKVTHFYVVYQEGKIIGCGAVGPYWDKTDESCLFTVFVHPDYQRKGVGRKIIETLEQDEYFLNSKRVEVPSSITACDFYRKMGYAFKKGGDVPDADQLYRLEKYR